MTNIYARDVSKISTLDPYRLQELYQMHPCAEHVVKKLLVAGEREGGKNLDTDISDCVRTLQRWQAMREEDGHSVALDGQEQALYNWSVVGAQFHWIARDLNGCVFAYEGEPEADSLAMEWNSLAISRELFGVTNRQVSDWKQSLERRP